MIGLFKKPINEILITRAVTLQRFIEKGWYDELKARGYSLAIGCGRFKKKQCNCLRCNDVSAKNELSLFVKKLKL